MARYKVTVDEGKEDSYGNWCQTLTITNEEGSWEYTDRMEPEDARFCRDLSWIREELDCAYELGYRHGKEDGRT